VQLLTTIEQVAQSPVQAVATPEMLMYPGGIVIWHLLLKRTKGTSQARQTLTAEQLTQF
jgi:hypothetical protein